MKFSVVIPTYNRCTQVLRAVESVLAQTVPLDEIIVVDDGSVDGTVESIQSRYGTRLKVIRQENRGVSAARNRGAREAKNEWIAFLDSDDIWYPSKIERQREALKLFGKDCGVCFSDNRFGNNPEMTFTRFEEIGFVNAPGMGLLEKPARYIVVGREPFFTSSLVLRRELLLELGGFDESLIVGEDADMVFRLSFRTKFCFVADVLVEVDRTPSRVGLCNLYVTRDDRKYESFERRYTKWLSMNEVVGSEYAESIYEMLREFRFDSAEAKIHELRFWPALSEIRRLNAMGQSYLSLLATLFTRKIAKARRNRAACASARGAQLSGKERSEPCVYQR